MDGFPPAALAAFCRDLLARVFDGSKKEMADALGRSEKQIGRYLDVSTVPRRPGDEFIRRALIACRALPADETRQLRLPELMRLFGDVLLRFEAEDPETLRAAAWSAAPPTRHAVDTAASTGAEPRLMTEHQVAAVTREAGAGSILVLVSTPLDGTRKTEADAEAHAARLATVTHAGQTLLFVHAVVDDATGSPAAAYFGALDAALARRQVRGGRFQSDVGRSLVAPVGGALLIVVTKNVGGKLHAAAAFQEVRQPDSASRWLRLEEKWAIRAGNQLLGAIVPVVNPPLHVPILENERRYWELDPRGFGAVLNILDFAPDAVKPRMPTRVLTALREQCRDVVRVLEIGGRDLRTSSALFYAPIERMGRDVQLVALEPSPPRSDHREAAELMARHHGVFVRQSVHDPAALPGERYDLIVANHRLYFSSPAILTRLLLLLRPGGFLIVLHSPREGNVFSRLCELTRDLLPTVGSSKGDPHRTYSEDLVAWLTRHGVAFDLDELHGSIALSRLLDGDEIHPDVATAIGHFLLDRTDWQRSEVHRRRVLDYLLEARDVQLASSRDGTVRTRLANVEHLVTIERPDRVTWEELLRALEPARSSAAEHTRSAQDPAQRS